MEEMNLIDELSQREAARIAGVLYLLVIVCGVFANFVVRMSLIDPEDAAKTAENIRDNEFLFRLGFVSDLIMLTSFVLLGIALYVVLKPVNKGIASLFVLFNAIGAAIICINLVNLFAALLILSDADYLTAVFTADQLDALALFFLELHEAGYILSEIFTGLWLLPLGYLVYKSDYFPRILGVLLMLACFAFQIAVVQFFLLPDFEVIIYPGYLVSIAAEFGFCGWLLLKGANIPEVAS
jgi:hypothetical protein